MTSDGVTTKNAVLAYEVLDLIGKHQHALDMLHWGARRGWNNMPMASVLRDRPIDLAELTSDQCGTTACMAGWTIALAGHRIGCDEVYDQNGQLLGSPAEVATELLGLSGGEAEQLFIYTSDDQLPDQIVRLFGADPRPQHGKAAT